MDISEVARKSGVAASALRYYERKGLIHSLESQGSTAQVRASGAGPAGADRAGAGGRLLAGRDPGDVHPGGEPDIDRTMLSAKADELERMVKRLKAMIEGLRHAAACPAPSHAACPSFQRLLKAAAAGALESRDRRASAHAVSARPGRVGPR